MNRYTKRCGGFSILEILIVAAILIALVAIGIPLVNRVRNQGLATKCSAKLREVGLGMHLYLGDHNHTFPTLATAKESRDDTETPTLEGVLLEYVGNEESVFHCPADHTFFRTTGSSYFWNTLVNGQRVGDLKLLGSIEEETVIPIVSDKENFHQYIGAEVTVLYADGSTLKGLKFVTEPD